MNKLLEIASFVIGLAVLPAFPKNADPLEGQGAKDYGVFLAFLEHALVIDFGPLGVMHRLTCLLNKGLAQERGCLPAPMRPNLIATFFSYGSHSGIFLQTGRIGIKR